MPTNRKAKKGILTKKKPLTNEKPALKLMGVNQQTRNVWLIAEVNSTEEAKKMVKKEPHTEYYLMDSYNQVYLLT
jgi:hypothetical protein